MKETNIFWANGDNVAEVITTDINFQRRIKKAAKKYKDVVIDLKPCKENDYCMQALIPIDFIQFRQKAKRNYSPEERESRRKQMQIININKSNN